MKENMDIEIIHFEDQEYIPRRSRVDDFVQEYTCYLASSLKREQNKKNPYRDPDSGKCKKIFELVEKIWGEKLPEKWGTDQLGFSAPTGKRTIYGKYLDESTDHDKCEFVSKCIYNTRTIGGCFVWPKVKRIGLGEVSEYNTVRGGWKKESGTTFYLEDRPDIAILEIKHFFEKYTEYGCIDFGDFIDKYHNDADNKKWMIFDYTSNYPSNQDEYKEMFIWLTSFKTFEKYCEHFGFVGNFVIKENEDLKIIDIVNSDIQEKKYIFLEHPVKDSIYNLSAGKIRKMLENVQCLVIERSRKIHLEIQEDANL